MDARPPCRVIFRAMMPSEKSQDIRALRKHVQRWPDRAGDPSRESLLEASLAVAVVAHDKRGNVELAEIWKRIIAAETTSPPRSRAGRRRPRTAPAAAQAAGDLRGLETE